MATENLSKYNPIHIENVKQLNIGIVYAEWNASITHNLRDAAIETLIKEGIEKNNIDCFAVSGAFELSYAGMQMAKTLRYDAIIAIGCIIRGETPHFDYVCSGVTQGITQINLLTNIPTIFCVLTDLSKEQSMERSGGKLGNKGVEAAATALEMIAFKSKLKNKNKI